MTIREYLKNKKLIADGAFGTYFSQINNRKDTISEKANLLNPQLVKKIHMDYMKAGARLLRTNTFAVNYETVGGSEDYRRELIRKGYQLAKDAVKEFGEEIYIGADIGPIPVDIHLEHGDVLREYKMMLDTFLECGADIFVFETFSDIKLIRPLVSYLKEKNQDIFIITQFCLNRYGYTKTGVSGARLLKAVSEIDNIEAVGFNCGIGSGHLYGILKKMDLKIGKYITAMPNSGYPEMLQDRMVYLDNVQYFGEKIQEIAKLGVSILGGCCGTNPSYIEETIKNVNISPVNWESRVSVKEKEVIKEKTVKNDFMRKLIKGEKVIAVELDPPYDARVEKIMECSHILKAAGVDMLTFADSPMGRGRVDSMLMSTKVLSEVNIPVMPHIACRDKNLISMRAGILGGYINQIKNLLIVTGDPIPSSDRDDVSSVFDFNSVKLMEYVSQMNLEHFVEEPIYFGGALNHGRKNLDREIERMAKKKAAGASYFLTQPIFTEEDIKRIEYIKSKIDTKILCGIMPLISYKNASFIRNEITGINVPEEIVALYDPKMSRDEGEAVGISIARTIMNKLDHIADGYYFMLPFNRVHLVEQCMEG